LKVSDENRRIRIRIRIRIHELEAWIRRSGSTPKIHGSGTLDMLLFEREVCLKMLLLGKSRLEKVRSTSEVDFLNFKGAQESIPRKQFRKAV
jgi:hypothetical protein